MKQRLQGIVIGILIGAMLTCGTVFAQSISKTVEIVFNNIKIFIDGAEYTAKDANGNVVEPFVYNGTTYLPVRGIANAFGKDIIWDGKTSSIYLGKKDQNQPDIFLDRIQYSNFVKGQGEINLWRINGNITDYLNNDYSNGMLFYHFGDFYNRDIIEDDKDNAHMIIDYPINGQYKALKGNIVLPKVVDIAGTDKRDELNIDKIAHVLVYGDGVLLKKMSNVTATMPFKFDLDVAGINSLSIKILGSGNTYIALTDLALYK